MTAGGNALCTNDGRLRATVTGFVTRVDETKKSFIVHVVQNVLMGKVFMHIDVHACMDCSTRTWHGKEELPQISNFVSFMGSVLFFEDNVAFVHVDDIGFVICF